jgi:hypothetical protein
MAKLVAYKYLLFVFEFCLKVKLSTAFCVLSFNRVEFCSIKVKFSSLKRLFIFYILHINHGFEPVTLADVI